MIIVTTLVIPVGGDAGPFDLYTDSDGYAVPFATNISAAALQAGYSSTVPNDATIVRVVSVGACTNFIDLDIDLLPTTTTTTSTSTSTSTTTSTSTSTSTSTTTSTTTSPPPAYYSYNVSSPGRESSGLACAETTFELTVYSDLYPLDFGHTVYTNTGLTAEFVGGNLWYLWGIEGTAYQIGNDGVITAFFNCP
jgi:hypothetical protein